MPPKKSGKKLSKHCSPESSWLSKVHRGHDVPDDVKATNIIKASPCPITEQNLADMGFVVGQKKSVICLLRQDGEGPQADTANTALKASGKDLLPGFNLTEEISIAGSGISSASVDAGKS